MAHDIFISYSTKDKPTADAACATLEAAGIRCWIAPRDILPGMEWGDAIIRAINGCRAMVLVFSSNANDSLQIRREVERAVSKGVPVIPLRIEDIAPTHSLEYFIGTVHWLDALSPPLESHLHRLSENVAALLNTGINPHKDSDAVPVPGPLPKPVPPRSPPPPPKPKTLQLPAWIVAAGVGAIVLIGGLVWWRLSRVAPGPGTTPAAAFEAGPSAATPAPPAAPNPIPAPSKAPKPTARTAGPVDPGVVGTLEFSAVIDDYDWHFVDKIAAGGTYQLAVTQEESGTYQASNGQYQTIGAKTHRARQGTYVALGADTVQVTNSGGTVVYRLQSPSAQNGGGPSLLGLWQSSTVVSGQPWTLTLQLNTDGTFHYVARAEDHGTCHIGGGIWQSTSALSGQSNPGTYQILSAHEVRLASAAGSGVWQRK